MGVFVANFFVLDNSFGWTRSTVVVLFQNIAHRHRASIHFTCKVSTWAISSFSLVRHCKSMFFLSFFLLLRLSIQMTFISMSRRSFFISFTFFPHWSDAFPTFRRIFFLPNFHSKWYVNYVFFTFPHRPYLYWCLKNRLCHKSTLSTPFIWKWKKKTKRNSLSN